ncbi:amidohydrolase family protein [Burkholderia sp. WAC0059]|uniref:amidohydrolase family protein n=1 Tax=Burkholderia sp. WAC0059 TaxID=2066022 RepID=UPI0011AFB7F6|nr:hypothetical protein [Burkholderia sp. WAC0059]
MESRSLHQAWVIQNTLYYDSSRGCLVAGDIEIEGGRIARIAPPRRSRLKDRFDGEPFVCLPGRVGTALTRRQTGGGYAAAEDHPWPLPVDDGMSGISGSATEARELFRVLVSAVLRGYTTLCVFAADVPSTTHLAQAAGLRVALHMTCSDRWLGEGSGPVQQPWDIFQRSYSHHLDGRESDTLRLGLGIGSQLCVSPTLTVRLHRLARESGRRLLVRVDDGRPYFRNFQDAYACSGIQLLDNLGVLDVFTTLVLDRLPGGTDGRIVGRSGASVIVDGHIDGTVSHMACWHSGADQDETLSNVAQETVDGLAWNRAQAIGLDGVGRIEANACADIRFHARGSIADRTRTAGGGFSRVLGDLPIHVLVNGCWAVKARRCRNIVPRNFGIQAVATT